MEKISQVPQAIDTARSYAIACTTPGPFGAPIVGVFTGLETLQTRIWPGLSEAAVAAPATTWKDPRNGIIRVDVLPSDLAGLAPAVYRIAVTIWPGTQDIRPFDGAIALAAACGSDAAGPAYGTYGDMAAESGDWLASLQADSDTAGFADVRAGTRNWLDRTVLSRIERALIGEARLFRGPRLRPIDPASAIVEGPWWGAPGAPAATVEAQLLQWGGMLTAGSLMAGAASPDRGAATRLASLHSLFTICRRQVGKDSKTPFATLAAGYAADVRGLLATWNAYIDADLDGSADYIVGP